MFRKISLNPYTYGLRYVNRVLTNFPFCEPQKMHPKQLELLLSSLIVKIGIRIVMAAAINFDGEHELMAEEIDNVVVYWYLPVEFPTQRPILDFAPQQHLAEGTVFSEGACPRAQCNIVG